MLSFDPGGWIKIWGHKGNTDAGIWIQYGRIQSRKPSRCGPIPSSHQTQLWAKVTAFFWVGSKPKFRTNWCPALIITPINGYSLTQLTGVLRYASWRGIKGTLYQYRRIQQWNPPKKSSAKGTNKTTKTKKQSTALLRNPEDRLWLGWPALLIHRFPWHRAFIYMIGFFKPTWVHLTSLQLSKSGPVWGLQKNKVIRAENSSLCVPSHRKQFRLCSTSVNEQCAWGLILHHIFLLSRHSYGLCLIFLASGTKPVFGPSAKSLPFCCLPFQLLRLRHPATGRELCDPRSGNSLKRSLCDIISLQRIHHSVTLWITQINSAEETGQRSSNGLINIKGNLQEVFIPSAELRGA